MGETAISYAISRNLTVERTVDLPQPVIASTPQEGFVQMPVYEEIFSSVSESPEFNAVRGDVMAEDRLVLKEFRRQKDIYVQSEHEAFLHDLGFK